MIIRNKKTKQNVVANSIEFKNKKFVITLENKKLKYDSFADLVREWDCIGYEMRISRQGYTASDN